MRDEVWMKQAAEGDREAMEQLIRRYYPEILRYCIWHTPNRQTGEDAAQETFLKWIRYSAAYRFSGKLRPFLYKIAANTCVDIRREKWNEVCSLEELDEEVPCEEPEWARLEQESILLGYVRALPKAEREVVLLRFGQDLTLREIAEITGTPMRTVQSRLRSAMAHIRKKQKGESVHE